MCLSTVYQLSGGQQRLLCKNVAAVQNQDGRLVFTDIMGVRTETRATIERIDLMENCIFLREADQEPLG